MRINKFFTDRGICSRREADKLIEAKRVTINGRTAVLGDQITDEDEIRLNGKVVGDKNERIYLMYNKPFGVTCTTDKRIAGNIIDAIKHPLRIFPIGRLDKASTGLILLTNDGDIVNKILRAQYGHEKEYVVETNKPYDADFIKEMGSGVDIGDYVTKTCRVTRVNPTTFNIILTEGKNRQIRRMTESLGLKVKRLHRIRIMNIRIGTLPTGACRPIPLHELDELKSILAAQTADQTDDTDIDSSSEE